jgi:hypothetical protein
VTSREAVLLLSALQDVPIPDEDVEPVRVALEGQLELAKALDALELADVEPIVQFDPRWR